MEKGKSIIFCSGIINLIATYAVVWFTLPGVRTSFINGIGGWKTLPNLFINFQDYMDNYEIPFWAIYLLAAFLIVFLISGVLQLLVTKKKIYGIIGSVLPIVVSILILFGVILNLSPDIPIYLELLFGDVNPPVRAIFPLNYAIAGRPESIGTYFLLGGSIMGVVGSVLSKEEY